MVLTRVRQDFRDSKPGCYLGSSFYSRCFYENEDGDELDPEKGYLKGPLLVSVCLFYVCRCSANILLQTYKLIFTSPSSAYKENQADRSRGPRRRNVASVLGMDQRVTPRAIAYAAIQASTLFSSVIS